MGNEPVDPTDSVDLARRVSAVEAELSALRTSHAMFEALVESVPDFVVRISPDGRYQYVNRLAPGLTRDQVLGRSVFEFTDPEHHAVTRAALERVLATGKPASFEATGPGARGPSTPYVTRLAPILENGQVVALTLVSTDVYELKESARRLADHQDRLELAAEACNIGYWHWDASQDLVRWDPTACQHLGVSPDEGRTTYQGFLDRVHPGDRDRIQQEVDQSVALGRYVGLQFRTLTPAGELRWLMTAGRVEHDVHGQASGLLGCLLDITDRRRLEEQLVQAQRLDAVGQLAAGVAHNFNNLLAALVPTLELTARRCPDDAPLLRELMGAAERASEVVRQLTAFAGGSQRRPAQVTDAAELARRVAHLSRSVLDRAIVVDVVAPAVPVLVQIDGGLLEQALMNLVINARDALAGAIAEGRTARIQLDVVEASGPEPRVRVRVTDTGTGMTDDVRRRAFEPFFTTKPAGRGTGLGLSSVYATVTACGGELEIESAPGTGTTISLVVPAAVASPLAAAPEQRASGGRGELILLVDDDPTVRSAMTAVLTSEGYQVRGIGDPLEALEVFGADPAAFAVTIVDHSMPGLSGQALLERMLAIAPTTRAISFSGYDAPLSGARAQLAKPASVDLLLATVRQVLDEP